MKARVSRSETYIVDLAWSPDGGSIAVAGGEGAVVLVENVAQQPTSRAIGEHGMGVISVKWQPGGSAARLVRPGQRGRAVGCDDRRQAKKRLRPGMAWSEHIAFSSDGKLLATATGKALTLWDAAGEKLHQFEPLPPTSPRSSGTSQVAISPRPLPARSCVHRAEPPQFSVKKYSWPAACLTIAYSPNGKVLASGMQDGSVHFWISRRARIRRCAATPRRSR